MRIRIRDLREDRDLTQKNIADILGISREGYSKYERRENDIPTTILIKLANFYNTTTDYLLGLSDDMSSCSTIQTIPQTPYYRIRDLRKEHKLTQAEIAKKIGMSQTGYSNYETGSRDIPTDILIKLSDFYNVPTDYILGITDNPEKN